MTEASSAGLSRTPQAGAPKPSGGPAPGDEPAPGREVGLWGDAWRQLIRKPTFVIPSILILIMTSMAVAPWLWTSKDPLDCTVSGGLSRNPPSGEHWFGTSILGCDYYAQAIYGSRNSMAIAVLAAVGVVIVGGIIGMLAGYFGGWTDAILARITDIFLGLPFLLGAIVILVVLKIRNPLSIAMVLTVLAWTVIARIMRGSVIASKHLDYVQAARALGANRRRLMFRHILPNALAPVAVYATILLGGFVAAETALTFLGIGLQPPAVSWGIMINQHNGYFHEDPWLLLIPVGFVLATVLSFIMVADALRDALDPRLR